MKDSIKLKYISKIINFRSLGFICIVSALFINQFSWLSLFDMDNSLSFRSKFIFFVFDVIAIASGIHLIKNPNGAFTVLIRKILYLVYLLLMIELLSFATLKLFLPANIENRINLVLGLDNMPSRNISWITADLWSNYKPNPLNITCNRYGYRYGGGPKEKGKIRILCVGGSTTWGTSVLLGEHSYPGQLEKYLNNKGYNVDIVNSGVPAYTSAEVLTSLCFRGIYTEPDIVLIHTGGNDNQPLSSPFEYKADYSHWQRVRGVINDNVFSEYYYKYPFSTFRLFLIYYLKPGSGTKVGYQLSDPRQEMLAKTDLDTIKPIGLITNFRNIVSVSQAAAAKPVVILFNLDQDRKNSRAHKFFGNSDDFTYARNRIHKAMRIDNGVMDSISNALNIPVIPFDKWNPTDMSSWVDHSHLDSIGIMEKALYIGNYLINNKILDVVKYE